MSNKEINQELSQRRNEISPEIDNEKNKEKIEEKQSIDEANGSEQVYIGSSFIFLLLIDHLSDSFRVTF